MFNVIHIFNNLMTMVMLYPRDWASEYQWITPIGWVSKYQWITPTSWVSKYQWITHIGWVSEYQWITFIGLGIRVIMNNFHWLGIRVPINNPYWFGYQNQFIVRLSIIIYMKSWFLTKIYLIQIHIYNHIFNIQIYLWYFYILYFKSI